METSRDLEHLAGITAKVRRSEARIMKAYSALRAQEMRREDPLPGEQSCQTSSTSSEEHMALTEPNYFDQATQQLDLNPADEAALAASFTEIELPEIPEGEYPLDYNTDLQKIWAELQMRKARQLDDKKWCELAQRKLWAESKGRPITLNGAQVASYTRDGNFTRTQFEAEQPELAEKYTRWVTEQKLDTEALRTEHPKVYEAYRAPTLRFKNNPVAP